MNKILNVTMVKEGDGPSGRYYFTAYSHFKLTINHAQQIQAMMGCAPEAYDFMLWESHPATRDVFISTWQCSTSAD